MSASTTISASITVAPLPLSSSWSSPPYRSRLLFAPDQGAGSQIQPRESGRILIVEDDLLIAHQIDAALTEAGFDVVAIATTGKDALEAASTEAPDVVIVDIRLGGDRDGVDTALELFRSHGIRCIFASAYSDQEARRRAEPAAPLGWLQKPYSMAALTSMVRTAIKAVHGKPSR